MAVRFDADGEDYTRALALGAQANYTVTCWVKISVDRNSWQTAWSLDNGTGDVDVMQTDQDGTTMELYSDGNNPAIVAMTVGVWYFIAVSRAGTGGTAYYKAATSSALSTASLAGSSSSTNMATLRIGESPFGGEWLNGCVTDLKFWTSALTQAEVELEATQYLPNRTANLQAFYPLIKPETSDYSGNARTLSGGSGTTTEDGPPIPWWAASPRLILPLSASGNTVTLDGVSAAVGETTGTVQIGRALAGSVTAASTAAGELAAERPLEGATPAVSEATGNLAADRLLAVASSSAAEATGVLAAARELAGATAAAAELTGDLTIAGQVALAGDVNAAVEVDGALSTVRPLTGSVSSTAELVGALNRNPGFASAATTAAELGGTVNLSRALAGAAATAAEVIGALTVTRPLAGSCSSASSLSGGLTASPLVVPGSMTTPDRTGPHMQASNRQPPTLTAHTRGGPTMTEVT